MVRAVVGLPYCLNAVNLPASVPKQIGTRPTPILAPAPEDEPPG